MAKDTMALAQKEDEFSLDFLLKAQATGKITEVQQIRLGNLLISDAQNKQKKFLEDKIQGIKDYILAQGLTVEAVYNALKPAPKLIFKWTDSKGVTHERFEGEIGKLPTWTTEMKKALTEEEAKKFVVNAEVKGTSFVENLYKVKP